MSPDEFDLFLTYLYLFGNKRVKYKLSFFLGFPDDYGTDYGTEQKTIHVPIRHINLNLNSSFSVPVIDDGTTVLTSAYVVSDNIRLGPEPTKFIDICCQTQDEEPRLLIFRAATTGKRMMNLHSSDVVC
jgi:hypothetical protein